jgi:glycosyltransferase involved in cell wall biosynthesis
VKILQLMSCRGWSSDAYWAARMTRELTGLGHEVTLGCRTGTEARVIDRARREGVERVTTLSLVGGARPVADARDLLRLRALMRDVDVVHVHRGKEHWLAAVANRLIATPRPIVRTRHIAQAVRPHAANRWLYRRGTAFVVTVTDAIRRQYVAAGLVDPERVAALPGGADAERYRPRPRDPQTYASLGGRPDRPLIGMIAGLRVMKGHEIVVEAAARLAARGSRPHFVFIGRGPMERAVRAAIERAGLGSSFTFAGFVDDLPAALAALDVVLYTPLESDGMSRVIFEYLAAGRPLIAARVGVVPEVLTDGEHAALVPAGDAQPLAEALARLVGDPAAASRLGAGGRSLVEARYSGARVAAALEARYQSLVAAGAA